MTALPPQALFADDFTPAHIMRKDIFGYYDDPTQAKPAHDPGPEGLCPVCCWSVGKHGIDNPVKTISLAAQDPKHRTRSFFFRAHKNCWGRTTPHNRMLIESSVIDEHVDSANAKVMTRPTETSTNKNDVQ